LLPYKYFICESINGKDLREYIYLIIFYKEKHINIYENQFNIYIEKYKDCIDTHNVKKLFYQGLEFK
jgi:hypothetical protein